MFTVLSFNCVVILSFESLASELLQCESNTFSAAGYNWSMLVGHDVKMEHTVFNGL